MGDQGGAVGLPVLAGGVRDDRVGRTAPASSTPASSNVSRTAAHTMACAVAGSSPDAPPTPRATGRPSATGRSSRGSTPAARVGVRASGEGHGGASAQHVDGGAAGRGVPQQQHGRGPARGRQGSARPFASARMRSGHSGGYHWPLVVDDMAGCYALTRGCSRALARRRAPADAGPPAHGTHPGLGALTRAYAAISTWISTSTGASSGSTATPTALRACTPLSPSTSPSSSLAPLMTPGCPVKSGAEATKPTTLTTRSIRSRSPTTDLTAASALSAQVRGQLLGLLRRDLGADLAGDRQLAVHHRQLAGGVDVRAGAHGRAGTRPAAARPAGSVSPSSASRVLDRAHACFSRLR